MYLFVTAWLTLLWQVLPNHPSCFFHISSEFNGHTNPVSVLKRLDPAQKIVYLSLLANAHTMPLLSYFNGLKKS